MKNKETKRKLKILGIRGVPAAHGGFETFAEHLAIYLIKRGWDVTVYCQEVGTGPVFEDTWNGVKRVRIPIATNGASGTIIFDWRSILLASREKETVLTLGYNTAIFSFIYRLAGLTNIINMDGVEWRREKWGMIAKLWFWLNDWAGCWLGNHLVADHPEILRHLSTRVSAEKITMIPYGADKVEMANSDLLSSFELIPGSYAILIARAEPENSILEVVQAWSRVHRGCKLVVLGKYEDGHAYQRAVKDAASAEVIFPGAVYEKSIVQALRFYSRFYVHGHRVGGTNPSLVESLGAANAVLAHNNKYNRWVAGDAGIYFDDVDSCEIAINKLLTDTDQVLAMQIASRSRHAEKFTWDKILSDYEQMLLKYI